jgi:hypothetical protein
VGSAAILAVPCHRVLSGLGVGGGSHVYGNTLCMSLRSVLRVRMSVPISRRTIEVAHVVIESTKPFVDVRASLEALIPAIDEEIRDRSFENRRNRAGGLKLTTAAVVFWNPIYLERAKAF